MKILDVPYQNQEILEEKEEKDWCTLASLWMILAFYLKDQVPPLEVLHQKYRKHLEGTNSFVEVGIEHRDLVKIARDYGLHGFRKSWFVHPGVQPIIDRFKYEGETDEDIQKWDESNTEESLFSLERWINQGIPVIISVNKGFSPSAKTHVVVLVGVEDDQFIIHDPFKKGANFKISKEEFKKYWLRQAIIISK